MARHRAPLRDRHEATGAHLAFAEIHLIPVRASRADRAVRGHLFFSLLGGRGDAAFRRCACQTEIDAVSLRASVAAAARHRPNLLRKGSCGAHFADTRTRGFLKSSHRADCAIYTNRMACKVACGTVLARKRKGRIVELPLVAHLAMCSAWRARIFALGASNTARFP